MIIRRPLSETIVEIAENLLEATSQVPLHMSSVELRLPVDLRFPDKDNELTGSLPLFRLRTAFDPEPAELYIVLGGTSL